MGGEQEALAQHDIQLDRLQRLAIDQCEHHEMHQFVGVFHLRPLISLRDVLDDQGVDLEAGSQGFQISLRSVLEIDPDACLRVTECRGDIIDRSEWGRATGLGPRDATDDARPRLSH